MNLCYAVFILELGVLGQGEKGGGAVSTALLLPSTSRGGRAKIRLGPVCAATL